ncbi:MAG: hypothetical protein ACFFCM_15760, partial [Promethearchaeota archaeon]
IQKLIEYLSHFRAFKQEFKHWNLYSLNVKLYERNLFTLNQIHPSFPLENTINNLEILGVVLKITPIYQTSLWDKFLQYSNDLFSTKIKWSSINKMALDDLSKNSYYHIISYKTGKISRWKRLLIFDPYFESLKKVLMSKVILSFNENKKFRKKYEELLRETEKALEKMYEKEEKQIRKREKKEEAKAKIEKSNNEKMQIESETTDKIENGND